ncbi:MULTISPECIES: CbtA family protein [Natrialbaceae]|uniref:CbtA family protein n=1 Tax=Natrialbaceae TaxID=1644061 RepID=UPI00207CEB34|nr:CbtA family protein [Natronococcus sp. CG52]
MIYQYLRRGVLAGAVTGIAYGLFVAFVANPLGEYLHHAQRDRGHGHDHAHEPAHAVSETMTAVVSTGSGVLWAIFLGGVFALALYLLEPALPGRGTGSAFVLAGAGFLTVSVIPWLVLPPAAPGAEQLYGIETRLAIYVGLVAFGAAVSAAAIVAYDRAPPRHRSLGIVAAGVPIVATAIVLPPLTPTIITHPGLSGELVSAYQGMVVLSQAAVWATLAATFGWLQGRERPSETAGSNEQLAASPHR